jgi:flagellin
MSSILTNSSALVALQTLKSTNVGLAKAQNEISTGLKVATAKDNSSSWSIASTMKSDVKSFAKLSETVVTAGATVGTARAAAEQVADILKDIQAKFVQAEDYAAGSPELTAIQDEVTALTDTIVSIATAAQVNGVNLTATGATALDVTVSVVRDNTGAVTAEAVTVAAQDLEVLGAALTVGTDTLDDIDTLLDSANAAAAAFGAARSRPRSARWSTPTWRRPRPVSRRCRCSSSSASRRSRSPTRRRRASCRCSAEPSDRGGPAPAPTRKP